MKNKLISYTSKIAFLTVLIAGYQLPNPGLQNIAVAYAQLTFFASVIVLLAILSAIDQKKPIKKFTNKPKLTVPLNIATSLYFIYNEAIVTGIAFLFATLFLYIANQMILDQKDEEPEVAQ